MNKSYQAISLLIALLLFWVNLPFIPKNWLMIIATIILIVNVTLVYFK